jgi:hypothetical protein
MIEALFLSEKVKNVMLAKGDRDSNVSSDIQHISLPYTFDKIRSLF